ncbi:hypothetical protein F5Y10DRAFT_269909 [Nemania abortiva]|nr:hypothetical protein F5Y10DRAFT_269909 [Nemania abortiva]
MLKTTVFTELAMGLASRFPELDPVAILELVEAPVVRLAFYELCNTSWDQNIEEPGQAPRISSEYIKSSIEAFEKNPMGGFGGLEYRDIRGGGLPLTPELRGAEATCFSIFMSRIYAWAMQPHPDLRVSRYLQYGSIRLPLLWGILGICISLYGDDRFPRPLYPLPEITYEDHMDDWEFEVTGSLGYSSAWFPEWQEWRLRYEALKDETDRNAIAQFWSCLIFDKDMCQPHGSAASQAKDFIGILHYVKNCDNNPETGEYETKQMVVFSDPCAFNEPPESVTRDLPVHW